MSIATLIFTGRLGRDAETRHTQAGKSVTTFTVATDLGWGDRKKTLWIDCALWEERGEKLQPYLTKGTPVTVQGSPDVRAWVKDGDARAVLQCSVREIEMQGGKRDDNQQGGGSAPPMGGPLDDDPDSIPF